MAGLDTLTLKATPWKVVNLANLKRENKLHLPDLQRGFVWAADRVRALHDSLYRRYPVGALLLWKPTWQGSEAPFATRAWDLFPPDPSTGRGVLEPATAIQPGSLFVLDGQQRLTSILRVIYRSRMRDRTTPDPDLLVALSPNQEWVQDPFHLRSRGLHRRMKDGLLVPAEVLFEGVRGGNESLAIQKAIGEWLTASDEMFFKAFDRANAIRNSILQAEIIAYEIDADADDDNVIEIFARLNQQGVRLRPGDLAAARLTGQMSNFRARARAVFDLPELAGFAVPEGKEQSGRSGSFVDTDLLIRTAMQVSSGVVRYRDAEKQEARAPYEKIEGGWNQTVEGFKGAIQMYRSAGVPSGDWLPYRYLLLPPAVASAKGHVLQRKWLGWAVAASLWGHYAGETETKLQRDANLAEKGDVDGVIEQVKTRAKRTESAIPDEEDFLHNIVGEGGVFLAMLLMFQENKARSFPGGKLITGADEPLEVHHIFPRAILDLYAKRDNEFVPDRLGNLTILTRSDNEHLSDTPPSNYLATVHDADILEHHMIPSDRATWNLENYREFCEIRERTLAANIAALLRGMGLS